MNVNEKICKAYDIRGVYKKDFDEDTFYKLGNALAGYLNKVQGAKTSETPKIVVGRDVRASSKTLAESFIKGVTDYGYDVIDLEEVTTPMFTFAVAELKAFGGAMITASHNPSEYNGLKLAKEMAHWIGNDWTGDKELDKVCGIANAGDVTLGTEKGKIENRNISEDYINRVAGNLKITRKLLIAVDASGGVASLFLTRFLEKLGVDFVPLFFIPDGSFSKHNPNPVLEESQIFVKEKIAEVGADFGVIFDGDGDRIVLVDEKSEVIRGDIAGCIIADKLMESKIGGIILYDTTSTKMIKEYFGGRGISTKKVRIGHTFVKSEMEKTEADFAMEISAHYYFKSMYSAGSAFYALRLLIEAMDGNPALKMSELASKFNKYFSTGSINFPLKQGQEWEETLTKIKEEYSDGRQSFEDGVSVEYENPEGNGTIWWFNIRPSNTEPLVRLTIEAESKELLKEKKQKVINFIESLSQK